MTMIDDADEDDDDDDDVRTLLYGNDTYEIEENKIIIIETLRFIKRI